MTELDLSKCLIIFIKPKLYQDIKQVLDLIAQMLCWRN
jgi:hypothetical protein